MYMYIGKSKGGVVVKQVPKESFFNFFATIDLPDEDTDIDEEEVRTHVLLSVCVYYI